MNTNITATNDIRELTMDETKNVSGGNPVLAFFVGYVATKVLDEGPGALRVVKKMMDKAIEDKKGNPQ